MNHVEETFEINNKVRGKKATLVISGYISPWNNNAGSKIQEAFRALEAKYDHIHIDLINCYGGTIWEGWPTFNVIHSSSKKVTVHAEGLVASMGTILYVSVPLKNRTVARGSRLMTHKASGGAMGDYEKLAEMSELMKGMEDELIEAVADQTGNTEEYVRDNWFKRGSDKYFSPKQAVEAKLAAKVIGGKKVKNALPEDIANSTDLNEIAGFFTNQINNVNSNIEMDKLPLFIAALKGAGIEISNEANEQEVLLKVQALVKNNADLKAEVDTLEAANTTLKDQAKNQKEGVVKNLIDGAIEAGKLKEDQRESMTNYANTDLDGATKFINSLEGRKSFTQDRGGAGGSGSPSSEDRSEWTLTKWRKEDPQGLAKLKDKDPEAFNQLVKDLG